MIERKGEAALEKMTKLAMAGRRETSSYEVEAT